MLNSQPLPQSSIPLAVPTVFVASSIGALLVVGEVAEVIGGLEWALMVSTMGAAMMTGMASALRSDWGWERAVPLNITALFLGLFAVSISLLFPMAYDSGGGRTDWAEGVALWISISMQLAALPVLLTGLVGGHRNRSPDSRRWRAWQWVCLGGMFMLATGHLVAVYLISYDLKGV